MYKYITVQIHVLHLQEGYRACLGTLRPAHLFEDEEVEEDHAEVVYDQGLAELEGLPVLHVLGPQPEEQQVGAADGQRGQRVVHQGPFLHPLVCRAETQDFKHLHPTSG